MRPQSISELRTVLGRLAAAPADGTMGSSGYSTLFSASQTDKRGRQLEETWESLLDQLREPVDTTLRGGMPVSDIAYQLGELVHNYYRTRGVALTSFELRRIVVALLDSYRSGRPALADPSADMAAAFAGAAPARDSDERLVAFVDRDNAGPRPPETGWNDEAPATPRSVETPDLPSSLVSLKPRPNPRAAVQKSASETPSPDRHAGPARVHGDVSPVEPAVSSPVNGDAALAAIMPTLQRQRSSAPDARAQRHEVMRWLQGAVASSMAALGIAVAEAERASLEQRAFDELFGLGPLEALLRDDTVSAIFVNAPHAVFVERGGRSLPARVAFDDAQKLDEVAERLARRIGASLPSVHSPVIDRELEDGTRVVLVAAALAPNGPCLMIRRPVTRGITLDALATRGLMSSQMAGALRLAVHGRLNILICGRFAAGKTVLLAALARAVASEERMVTIEAGADLRPGVPHHVSLIVGRDTGIDAGGALSAALALRPDRLVVDGVSEAMMSDIADAADDGRDGMMLSLACATPREALDTLWTTVRDASIGLTPGQARRRLMRMVDLVIHVERLRDGGRRITHVADVAVDGETVVSRDLFALDRGSGRFVATGLQPSFLPRLHHVGLGVAFARASGSDPHQS